jgi:hypothetical protein
MRARSPLKPSCSASGLASRVACFATEAEALARHDECMRRLRRIGGAKGGTHGRQ